MIGLRHILTGAAVALTMSSSLFAADCNGVAEWQPTTVYLGGDQATQNNQLYTAAWWTQNQSPETHSGPWQEWKHQGECEGTNPPGNEPPTAIINGPFSAKVGDTIAMNATASSDADGFIESYSWTFGDGASSNEMNPAHQYNAEGTYDVTLEVTDDDGAKAVAKTTATISNDTPPPTTDAKVIGYFAEWGVYGRDYHVKDIATSGSADRLTHILYAFGNVKNGKCTVGDSYAAYDKAYSAADSVDGVADTWDTGALRGNIGQFKRLKEMYPHLKIIWSFGGWTWSGGFGEAAQNPDAFAESCYQLINDPRWAGVFDGIDIDWEYPNECGLTCDNSGFDGYRNLMAALRARFGTQLVTSAIGAAEAKLRAADYGGAAPYVDFYMLMTYDYFGAFNPQGPTAPHSPLYSYNGIPTDGFYSDKGIQVLKSLGVPSDKILLGIGFYGRGWTGVTQSAPGGSASGAAQGEYEAGINDYKILKQSCPATGLIAGTAYAHCGNNWWSYDTPQTIQSKMDYVKQQGLDGAFFWELSGDTADGELIRAIDNGLK
ncbi:putative chitinase C precursor [Reinekea sp. MED297]|uniref:chitinase n=2 Tax=Reinekea TaxID=230494 RepID=A4BBI0_9GAMM|nr:putative chitinase C precursor [Reinekea sp. MED297] [Reinekea blandensis MED297]